MKKILAILMTTSVLLSGCSSLEKESVKNKPIEKTSKESKESKEKENKEQDVNKEENKKEVVKLQHDKEVAKSLASDPISFGINNFDINTRGAELTIPPGFISIPTYSKNRIEIIDGKINIVPLNEFVDVYNTYNREVYNEEDVVASIKEILTNNSKISYLELDDKRSDKSIEELKLLLSKEDVVVFFKGDKKIAYNIISGVGGAGLPVPAPYEQWVYTGDLVEIPMLGYIDKSLVNTVVLKLNDKEYTGGKNKSLYYYYDVVKK